MTALSVKPPFPIFTDTAGQPLEDGFVYIGIANQDPVTNPITVYWDAALTIPASQPIRTLAGYPSRAGTPAVLYVNSNYSIVVKNKTNALVYQSLSVTERYGGVVFASDVLYDPAGSGAVQRTVESKLRESVSVLDFGADPTGATDSTVAIQAAIDYACSVHGELIVPVGTYLTSATLYIDQPNVIIYGEGNPSRGPGASRGLPGDVTQGPVIQYSGTTTAIQVSNSRSANPTTDPSNPGFIFGVQIHNLRIEVPADCQKALYVFQAASSYFFNITMWGSQSTGGVPNGGALLYVQAGIDNIFEKISTTGVGRYTVAVPDYDYYVNYGAVLSLGWGNDVATTTIFRRCYFNYCNVGVLLSYIYQFEDCIFEACKTAVDCGADVVSSFSRCWWEANTDVDVAFGNSIIDFRDCRLNSYARQQFFTTGGGVQKLYFDNVRFDSTNAAPYIFGVSPTGNNIFSTSGSTPKTASFNQCTFSPNTVIGNIYNSSDVNKIEIQNMQQETLTFVASSVGASATPTMNGTSGFASYTMQEAGDVIGVNIYASAAMTAGTYNIATEINSVAIADLSFPIVPIQSSFPFSKRIQPLKASFAKGDVISVYFNTDAAFSPSNNICFEVIVAYGPSGETA